jgi:hypothetical protein
MAPTQQRQVFFTVRQRCLWTYSNSKKLKDSINSGMEHTLPAQSNPDRRAGEGGKFKKQTGGHGQFADVTLQISTSAKPKTT